MFVICHFVFTVWTQIGNSRVLPSTLTFIDLKKLTIYRFKNMNIKIYTLLYILVYERELS